MNEATKQKRLRRKGFKYLLLVALTCVLASSLFFILSNQPKNPLPKDVQKSINFVVYIPSVDKSIYELDGSSITYSKKVGVLSFSAISKNNKITITQQAQPDTFTDIPLYYSQMLDKLHQYSEFTTGIGTVTLTHPNELNGGQSAVSKAGGTLLFAHPDKGLTDGEWKDFFNSVDVVK
jgi:hypothetical protein